METSYRRALCVWTSLRGVIRSQIRIRTKTHKKKQVPEEAFFLLRCCFCMVCFLYVYLTQYEYLGKI